MLRIGLTKHDHDEDCAGMIQFATGSPLGILNNIGYPLGIKNDISLSQDDRINRKSPLPRHQFFTFRKMVE